MATARGPKVAETPLELLNREVLEPGVLNKYFAPAVCGSLGVLAVVVANWSTRRPVLSGIQKHIISGVLGAAIGKYLDDRRDKRMAERDAILRNYVELHPEDFPPYERVKYRDLFEKWTPIR